jgi:hypothetical protein
MIRKRENREVPACVSVCVSLSLSLCVFVNLSVCVFDDYLLAKRETNKRKGGGSKRERQEKRVLPTTYHIELLYPAKSGRQSSASKSQKRRKKA